MTAFRLLAKLAIYYLALAVVVAVVFQLFPAIKDFLPVGRVEALIAQAGAGVPGAGVAGTAGAAAATFAHVNSLGESMIWLLSALLGALAIALPVAWVYVAIRHSDQYDQSLIGTIIVLPVVVTAIVVIVQNSLALAFSLAGIAGVARYRNSMKSSGDLMFVLFSIGIGLASGIGAVELAFVTSIVFNLCFITLWWTQFGERAEMKRYLHDFDPDDEASRAAAIAAAAAATGAAAVTVANNESKA